MPVIGVAIAIAATAVAASSAVAATTFSIGLALEVTAAVGATLSAVGSIAKIPGLQKAGMVIGAIGAVGSVASAAGLIDGSTALFGSATPVTDAAVADAQAAGTVGQMGSTGGSSIGPFSEAQSLAETVPPEVPGGIGAVNPATGEVITAPSGAGVAPPSTEAPMVLSSTSEPATGSATTAAGQTSTTAGTTASTPASPQTTGLTPEQNAALPNLPPGSPEPPIPPSTAPGTSAGTTATGATPPPAPQPGTSAAGAPTTPPAGTGMLGKIGGVASDLKDWAQKNQMLAYGMSQAGGSLISGAFSSLTPAQAAQANAQANLNNAQAAQVKTQTAAMTQPKAAATLAPVTGAPAPLVPGYGGNRQLAANQVTGMPASFGLINQAPQIGAA